MVLCLAACAADPFEGVVVAVQDESAVAFVTEEGVEKLDLATDGSAWMVHNVQIVPDGRTALATAMPADHGEATDRRDQLVVLDLVRRDLAARCELDHGLGAAHVVTDGQTAWVTAYDQDRIVVIDVATCATTARWPLPPATRPHGLRLSATGDALYVAGMGDGSLHRVDLANGDVTSWDLPGSAVQVAVLPDGSAVWVTLIDTVQAARFDVASEEIAIFDLPGLGPAQIYPSPDGGSVWIADQGLEDYPGRELLRLDAVTGEVTGRVTVGEGPHGVVVSPDGSTVWTTTLRDGTLDRVDAGALELVGSTPVGDGPNGLSVTAAP
jgi:DNA-binding beta-propeller fold protein YncE